MQDRVPYKVPVEYYHLDTYTGNQHQMAMVYSSRFRSQWNHIDLFSIFKNPFKFKDKKLENIDHHMSFISIFL